MIRQATAADLDQIADAYEEHFAFEETHPAQAFTVFKRGVYPTRRDAEKALADDGLTVYEEDGRILASSRAVSSHRNMRTSSGSARFLRRLCA